MYNPQAVYLKIKNLAKSQNIVLKEMLKNCGLGANTLSHMNHGKSIAFNSLAKIADYLGCTVDYLIGDENKPLPVNEGVLIIQRMLKGTVLVDENGNLAENSAEIIAEFLKDNAELLNLKIEMKKNNQLKE